ncbi:protein-disulfide reductase DsbD [Pseudoduganella ginsengisoli]|uniref:Thiol:disulfide interchange protein DsbD n=1 Tax=Pseudoduganella ginsengisoli TaxID=1462440 RepID=A0A6L6Q1G8_9BURK|nr:protein-disulfide reductase DsbD [Pseudoduganella ginsengisoli]MTW03683.1 protein-disulfide reductase DsbD [Pseudoduganella ginsengisoli]
MFQTIIRVLAALLLLVSGVVHAEDEFLDPAVAFKFSARMVDGKTAAVTFDIADGYYMYRERFAFKASGATLGQPDIPPGKVKFDDTFNKEVETYRHQVTIKVPVDGAGPFTLTVTGQGCSDKGLCYSPQDSTASLMAAGGTPVATSTGPAPAAQIAADTGAASQQSDLGQIESALKGGRLLVILPLFALLGLGLSFTPCVLPMVPILSSIVVGDGAKASRSRGLLLSSTYSLGMAIVYTALGVAAGLAGEGLAAALQNPWVLGAFGLLMALLALSMFGFYELQVPAALQSKLSAASNRQSGGRLAGVFIMGAISALIVGPCVAAPLAGALVYISQTRDVLIGGGALFAMAVGMSVPLLLVGVSAGALLPRAGMWMEHVKRFFGVLLLGVALWLVSPVLPVALSMAGFAFLGLLYGLYLLARSGRTGKLVSLIFLALGSVQLVGVATGGRDLLAPLAHLGKGGAQHGLQFTRIKTVAQLDDALAKAGGKTALLDFYADWCVSCKEMEKLTFVKPEVQARLANTVLLQVDVTANDADDKAMLKRFKLFGPPGIILFDTQGQEIPDARVVGFQDAQKFMQSLEKLK